MNTLEQNIAAVNLLIKQAQQRGETTKELDGILADYEAQLEKRNRFLAKMQQFDEAMRKLRKD